MTSHSDPLSQFILPIIAIVRGGFWLLVGLGIGWLLWG